jgi:hypothetical protein
MVMGQTEAALPRLLVDDAKGDGRDCLVYDGQLTPRRALRQS